MNNDLIFLPVLAHVVLVFMLYIYLGIVKSRAVKAGSVDRKKVALNPKAWPESVVKVLNNLDNQFESHGYLLYHQCYLLPLQIM